MFRWLRGDTWLRVETCHAPETVGNCIIHSKPYFVGPEIRGSCDAFIGISLLIRLSSYPEYQEHVLYEEYKRNTIIKGTTLLATEGISKSYDKRLRHKLMVDG